MRPLAACVLFASADAWFLTDWFGWGGSKVEEPPYEDPPWPRPEWKAGPGDQLSAAVAEIDPSNRYIYRSFNSTFCRTSYTLSDLSEIFSAHSIEWNILGRDQAWYSVIADKRWAGKRDIPKSDKDEFYKSGHAHVQDVQRSVIAAQSKKETTSPIRGTVLDFGCGLGRLGMAFAQLPDVNQVFCVDQSVHHLNTARAEWNSRRRAGVDKELHFVQSSPDLLLAMRGRRVNFVHSVIVMQHMVAPLQQVYLEQLCDLLLPGGLGWIQLPTAVANPILTEGHCDLQASIRKGGAQMHQTPVEHIETMLNARGCVVKIEDVGGQYLGQKESDTRWRSAVLHIRKRGPIKQRSSG